MADAEHIVEILLRARDETAAAFASAMEHQKALTELEKESQRQSEETGRAHVAMTERIAAGNKTLLDQQRELLRAEDQTAESMRKSTAARRAAIDDQVRLEAAAQRYTKTLADTNASEAQRVQALQRLRQAQDDYALSLAKARDTAIKSYNDEGELIKEVADAKSKAHARAIQEQNVESQQQRQLDNDYRRAHAQRMSEEKDLIALRRERARVDAAEGRAEQQRQRAASRDQEDAIKRLRAAYKGLSNENITPRDFDKFKSEIASTREELARMGVDGRTIMAQTRKAMDDTGVSVRNLRRATVEANQTEQIRNAILKDSEAAQKRLITQTKEYAREIDNLARLERQRATAGAHGADPAGLRELDSEIGIAKTRLRELATEIKAVSQQKIVVGVDADTGAAITDLMDFEAVKKVVGRDIKLNVDVDAGAAEAKLAALAVATKSGLHGSSEDTSWWKQFTETIEQSGNRVATFDNLLRGLVSLGIGVFFNQIIVLAGAAAGALTALASSAIYAGGAIGGALTAGIAQAVPVLGILAIAATRLMAVWQAAQQQQLLQQQTYAKTAKTAKQSADATDAITNAQDGLTAANKRVAQAQQGVIDARQKAIRQLQDLILQEKAAELAAKGASLSQEEAQAALTRAMSQGDTGAIARARLDVQQAGLGVRQATLNSSRTRQDLATRRAGGINGSPEVTQAKDQLDTAKKAADQAERSLAKAGRQMDVTGAQSIAAAGKLDFMLSQLSDSERKLYEQFSTFIDRFRVVGGKIAEPIIGSVTHMMDRVNGILANNAVVGVARDLATKISDQLTRIFDHFTTGKSAAMFLGFVNEAEKNLKPFTDIIMNLGDAFSGIATAAAPVFNELLNYFDRLTKRFADWTTSTKGQNALADFFKEGLRQFKLFMSLGGAVARLIIDIANPKVGGGAKTGGNLLKDMTGSINELDKKVRSVSGSKWLQNFFENSRKAIAALRPVVGALAQAFASIFTPEGIKNLQSAAKLVSEVLVPAFETFLHAMGLLMRVIGVFLEIPFVGTLAKWVIGTAAIFAIMSKLQAIFAPLTAIIKLMFPVLDGIGGRMVTAFGAKITGLVTSLAGGLRTLFVRMAAIAAGSRAAAISAAAWEKLKLAMIALGNGTALAAAKMKIVTAAQWLWNAAVSANPIVLIGIAIVALIAGLVLLQRRFNIFGKAWDAIKSAVSATVDFVKSHWKLIIAALLGPLGIAIGQIVSHWDDIKSAFKKGIDGVVGFMKALPGRIKNFAVDAANTVADAFTGIGGKILKGIVQGVKGAADFAKSIVNGIIGLVENAINSVDKIGPIHVPDVHLPRLASGGYVAGNYAEGDRYPALLAGDEVVMNPRQQAMVGRDRIMAALRATGAQVIGQGNGRFATGAIPAAAQDQRSGAVLTINADANMDGLASDWRKTWQEIVASTRRNAQDIEARIRTMRVNTTATLTKLRTDSTELFVETEMSGKVHFGRLAKSVEGAMTEVAKAVHLGFGYIARATNVVLKGFDADPVKFNIEAPPSASGSSARGAATGYLGQPGERGGDNIPIWVGRGEAVLNWAHQKMIEPALQAYYGSGLQDLFKRTVGYHSGGMGTPLPGGMAGFAKGGLTGPFGAGAAFNAVSNFAKKKFGMSMTAGRTNHSLMTDSGNVSDHSTGMAGDFSNGVLTPQEDAFSSFWKNKLPQTVKQLIWRNKDQFNGWPIPGHTDHVHLALKKQFAFDPTRIAKLISRAMRGLSISDLLAGATGGNAEVDHIDPLKVRGKGFLATIIRKALNKTRVAANTFMDAKALTDNGTGSAVDYSEHEKGSLSMAQVKSVIHKAMSILGIDSSQRGLFDRTYLRQAFNESRFNPNAQNKTAAGVAAGGPMGLLQVVRDTFARFMYPGHNNPFNPLDNSLASMRYVAAQYGGGNPVKGAQVLWNRGGGAYARGGYAGGSSPIGRFIRRAATGYWGGDDELARRRAIRTTGVYRAPSVGVAEGDLTGATAEFDRAVKEIDKRVASVKKLVGKTSIIVKNFTAMTREGGLLDQINVGIQKFSDHLALKLKLAVYGVDEQGNAIRKIDTDREASRAIAYSKAVLKRFVANRKRLDHLVNDNAKQLDEVNDRIGTLEDIAPKKRTDKQKKELSTLKTDREDLITGGRDLRKRAEEARQQIADQLEQLYQAQLDQFTKATEKSLASVTVIGMNPAQLERAQRVASANGDGAQSDTIASAQIDAMVGQTQILQKAMADAHARGYGDLEQQYKDQFDELNTSIAEAVATRLSSAIDAVDTASGRSLAANDRQQAHAGLLARVGGSGLLGGVGGAVAGAQGQADALAQRGTLLENQRGQYQELLRRAQSEGNIGQIQNLTDKLADLSGTIEENTVAQHEATVAVRQARIDAITGRQGFLGGVYGGLGGLVTAANANTQNTDQTQTKGLLDQAGTTLKQTLGGLADELLTGYGIDVHGQTGSTLAATLSGLNFDGIEANFSQAQKEQFENLINAIIGNATELEGNTQAVSQLTGTIQPQGFQSTAWSWFREAIFNGMGDVLPQYTIPSFDTGGSVIRGGMAKLHTGEYVTNPAVKGQHPGMSEGDINIEINEAGGVPDPNYLAARMAFERRAARSSN